MRGRVWHSLGLVLVVGALAACGEKSHAAITDAGDSAVLARGKDASAEGGANAGDGGASLEDLTMPQAQSDELSARMRHLLEAVSQNNPDLAGDAFFPRDAYVVTRDVPDPQKSWDKFSGAFRRAVERSHKRSKGIEAAKFVSFELGHTVAQLTPKKRDFKRPLWRVKHSKVAFTIDGKPRQLEIAEMTAWRGSWYVTRLR